MSDNVLITPKKQDIEPIKRVAEDLAARPNSHRLVLMDDAQHDAVDLPTPLVHVLMEVANQLAQGHSVAILPDDKELTTQQAANLLQVSRPFLIKLLETGHIPYHTVGSHRRILLRDLMEYKQNRDRLRKDRIHQIVRLSESIGLYESEDFVEREP
ncbi:helix-turn-helix domain-containing protein [Sulfobacillus thermosulfidooxidans]|uniref:helix-turn-helix domain-containing protein n=1 Tax=Sulfobacillus thermosulfidooxidans TaxID=28034 RepID=UPI0006B5ACE7|nr:helix-turn-helix domain-containing protein [Sulfobacillus thermosulfidooxidans]